MSHTLYAIMTADPAGIDQEIQAAVAAGHLVRGVRRLFIDRGNDSTGVIVFCRCHPWRDAIMRVPAGSDPRRFARLTTGGRVDLFYQEIGFPQRQAFSSARYWQLRRPLRK